MNSTFRRRVAPCLATVAACVLMSGCGEDHKAAERNASILAAKRHLKGLTTAGSSVGEATAPSTVSLFVDVASPNAYIDTKIIPALLDRFVRPGRARLQMRTVTVDDVLRTSDTGSIAARVTQAVGLQDRFWHFFFNLRSIRADLDADDTLQSALSATAGISGRRALSEAKSKRVTSAVARSNRYAAAASIGASTGEPFLIVESRSGVRNRVALEGFPDVKDVVKQIDRIASTTSVQPRARLDKPLVGG